MQPDLSTPEIAAIRERADAAAFSAQWDNEIITHDVPRLCDALDARDATIAEQAARIQELEVAHANCPQPIFNGTHLNDLGKRIIAEQRAELMRKEGE